jgi:hypothetical protein
MGETGNKNDNGLNPIAELFQDDYVSTIGSRHSNLLRVMDSLIQKHKHNLQLEQIKERGIHGIKNTAHPHWMIRRLKNSGNVH